MQKNGKQLFEMIREALAQLRHGAFVLFGLGALAAVLFGNLSVCELPSRADTGALSPISGFCDRHSQLPESGSSLFQRGLLRRGEEGRNSQREESSGVGPERSVNFDFCVISLDCLSGNLLHDLTGTAEKAVLPQRLRSVQPVRAGPFFC